MTVVNGPEFGGGGLVSGFVISLARKQLIEAFSPNGQGFHNPHDVAISTDGNQIYVVELDPYKVWKFVKGKYKTEASSFFRVNNFLLNL